MQKIIAKEKIRLLYKKEDSCQSIFYYVYPFDVPENTKAIKLDIKRVTLYETQLPIIVFDNAKVPRLLKASEGAKGEYKEEYIISDKESSDGVIDDEIQGGRWYLVIYKRRFSEDIDLEFEISVTEGKTERPQKDIFAFQDRVVNSSPGWYSGELHTHSDQSTGRTSVEEVVKKASEVGYDFIALTDHFTLSHLAKLSALEDKYKILLFASVEISSDRGHANLHGVRDFINPLVDESEFLEEKLGLAEKPSMTSLSQYIHSKGGLISINHAESGLVGWRHHDFDFSNADLFEAWCLAENKVTFLYPTLWASYLSDGYHLTAVGSSDSHHPRKKGPWELGQIRNYVKAEELSEKAIIKGLKDGKCYVALGESKMSFTASYKGRQYDMGETVFFDGGKITFSISIWDNPTGNVFIYLGKQIDDVFYVDKKDYKTEFSLGEKELAFMKNKESFIRFEFHEDLEKSRFFAMAYRSPESMRLLSNPIWIRSEYEGK